MATTLTVRIVNGEAVVEADGSKKSCDTAHELEKALGKVTKSVPTGHRPATATVVQK